MVGNGRPERAAGLAQWLLAALAYKWRKCDGKALQTKAVVRAVWMWNEFSPFDPDDDSGAINDELAANFYRLWGAGNLQNCVAAERHRYLKVRDALLEGRFIVEQSPQYVVVRDVYERIIAGLTDEQRSRQPGGDLETVFDSIYESGRWGRAGSYQGTSGSGSNARNSEVYLDFLQNFLREGYWIRRRCGVRGLAVLPAHRLGRHLLPRV